jgi:hypothetical protein
VRGAGSRSASIAKVNSSHVRNARLASVLLADVWSARCAASRSALIAKIRSSVNCVIRCSALIAKVPSSRAHNARPASTRFAGSPSHVMVNARMRSAASIARSCLLLVVARKATRVLPRRRKDLVLERVASIGHTPKK